MICVQVKNDDTAVMMIPDKIQLVVHYVMVISIENFVETRAQIRHPSYGNHSQSNVREIYYTSNFDRDRPRESRSSTDIPVTFKAPDVGSQNFWNYDYAPSSSNRRTFLGDLGYFNYGKTNLFPNLNSFFEFMNPSLDKGNIFKPLPQAVTKSIPEPYRYEYPYNFGQTTERNFLPPPKPIRASIVKLETITRSPEPFEYINSSEDLPHFSNFKPIPPAKPLSLYIDELGFHHTRKMKFKHDPNWNSKPDEFSTNHFLNNITSTVYIPSSAEVYQQSIKVMPSTIRQIFINDTNDTDKYTPITKETITSSEESGNITFNSNDSLIEEFENVRNVPRHVTKDLDRKLRKNVMKPQNSTTLVKYEDSKSATMSDAEETKSVQAARPYKRGNAIKIVTELTLEGLSRNNKTANIPTYPKFINMSDLIRYELNKIKQSKVPRPRSDEIEETEESLGDRSTGNRSFTDINTSDELSLDLKILKDTNWDGFTTEIGLNTEVLGIGTTEREDTLGKITNNNTETNFSYGSNKENNSDANYTAENEGIHDNKTIIVETRVTKTISKALPTKNRQAYKKSRVTNSRGQTRRNTINRTSKSIYLRNHTSEGTDLKSEIVPQLTKGKDYINSSDFTISYEASNTSKNAELHNETIRMIGKNLNESTENGLTSNLRRFNFTRRSRNGIHGTISNTPNVSLEDVSGEIPVNNTTDVEIQQNFDSGNETSNPEKVNTSNIMTIEKTLQSNIQNETENVEVKNIRKRKSKRRQKLKRRRPGKRRQNNTATTEDSNSALIIAETKIS